MVAFGRLLPGDTLWKRSFVRETDKPTKIVLYEVKVISSDWESGTAQAIIDSSETTLTADQIGKLYRKQPQKYDEIRYN